tara:strand:+ start:6032 stop:6268 length:237 start_codon:yes stop_codon:yes gene_type:complete
MAKEFKRGDLVKWKYSSPMLPYIITSADEQCLRTVGIVLNVEVWSDDPIIREVIEVFFTRGGKQWCNPQSIELVNKYS